MTKRKKTDANQKDVFNIQEQLSTAACVPAIRPKAKEWVLNNYPGITDTTRELLNYWFYTDHILPNGSTFRYHKAQKESIETLIYLFEVAKIRSRKDLLEKFAFNNRDLRLPPYDDFTRYCIKMATGSGKTKVMAMAIAWQFANAVKEDDKQYAQNFLILAPNIIVYDRLRSDFESGRVFRTDPLIPRHYNLWWDMEYYIRGDTERSHSTGAIYLTNIQQFYERADRQTDKEPDVMTAVMGTPPPSNKTEISDFDERIARREGLLMVLNDEAHHTWDEESEWNKFIRRVHKGRPLSLQLDVSATPRFSGSGTLFPWTIFDYPLKQAIIDNVVKRPIKGISKIEEAKSDHASVRYQGFITAGVERWREYFEQLNPLRKKPILFIMMNDTQEADDIGDWLRTKYPSDFGGEKTLVIHTDKSGEVSKKDLDAARKLARDVDDEKSPVNAIISVLMLREGWDVQNVTVVVGLRPYSSKAKILPEQTIGRGLRLMFRNLNYQERVDIIGNKAFMEFVSDLEKLEDLKLETFHIGKDKLQIITIHAVERKMEMDIGIPEISPLLSRKKSLSEEISSIDVSTFKNNPLPLKAKDIEETKSFIYEGIDILTNEKLLEREYKIPPAQTAEEVVGYYARRIAQNIKLPSQFSALAPKVREFFEVKAFGKKVDLTDSLVIRAMSTNLASYVVIKEFEKVLRDLIVQHQEPELISKQRMLSTTPAFPFSNTRSMIESKKTVFNFVTSSNEFEKAFARFLDKAEDVAAFAKLPDQFGFCIQYTDTRANIRNYFPDFILRLQEGSHWIAETKGREDVDVAMKDQAAQNWCETATMLTGVQWNYIKVLQKEFEELHPDSFQELELVN
jgi:type III restriction enzyme